MPWDKIELMYVQTLDNAYDGAGNKPARMIIGALITMKSNDFFYILGSKKNINTPDLTYCKIIKLFDYFCKKVADFMHFLQ